MGECGNISLSYAIQSLTDLMVGLHRLEPRLFLLGVHIIQLVTHRIEPFFPVQRQLPAKLSIMQAGTFHGKSGQPLPLVRGQSAGRMSRRLDPDMVQILKQLKILKGIARLKSPQLCSFKRTSPPQVSFAEGTASPGANVKIPLG